VCFKDATSASKAIEKLSKHKQADGSYMIVSPHVSKRENELTSEKSKRPINQNMAKTNNSLIFVSNIPSETSVEEIGKIFTPFGNIISIKLKKKNLPFARFMHAYILFETVENC
jgi:RNA recognition motif-containing protein